MCHTGFCHGEFAMLSATITVAPVALLYARRTWRKVRRRWG